VDAAIGIERLTAIAFIVTGLSHIAAPRAWARFFVGLREKGEIGGLINAWIHFPLGALILSFHWLWSWPRLLVTLLGCGLALKGALYFIRPGLARRGLAHVSEEKAGGFGLIGLVSVALGLVSLWISLRA
jgi:uncharacterized protein YjeT (DUF2065 family)